jgi:hypothetical protein
VDVLAHGVGSREDLPIPFAYALVGAGIALVASFVILAFLWRTPRFDAATAGRPVPSTVERALDGRWFRGTVRALGMVAFLYVAMAAVFGVDDALNPAAGVVYVLLWIGVPLVSIVFGPVWRLLNPIRTLHLGLARLVGTRPEDGMAPLPPSIGYWPAAASLFAFVWLELVRRTTRRCPCCGSSSRRTSRSTCSPPPTTGRAGSTAATASRSSPTSPAACPRWAAAGMADSCCAVHWWA